MADAVGSAIDPATFDGLFEAVGGDRVFLAELVAAFVSDAPAQMAALRSALDDRDVQGLVLPAHTLKSSSASLGALTLSERCGELEARARIGDLDGAALAVEAVRLAADEAVAELMELAPPA